MLMMPESTISLLTLVIAAAQCSPVAVQLARRQCLSTVEKVPSGHLCTLINVRWGPA